MTDEDRPFFDELCRTYYHKVHGTRRTLQFSRGYIRLGTNNQKADTGADIFWTDQMPQQWQKFFEILDSARAESERIHLMTDNIVQCVG